MRLLPVIPGLIALPILVAWMTETPPATNAPGIHGVWTLRDAQASEEWFFGRSGKGLHRAAQTEGVLTRTFRFTTRGNGLDVTFDKDGAQRTLTYTVADEVLVLREEGQWPRFYSRSVASGLRPSIFSAYTAFSDDGFEMLQLLAPTLGHGKGWLHVGDEAEWRTHAIQYDALVRHMRVRTTDGRPISGSPFHAVPKAALYRNSATDNGGCAFMHTRARFSRWMNRTPLPYDVKTARSSASTHENRCRAAARARAARLSARAD